MGALDVVLIKKTGSNTDTLYPKTLDNRINITSDSSKLPTGITSLEDLIDALGSLAFEDYVALNVSDESNYGLVKMSNSDSTATDTVPTSNFVHGIVSDLAGKVSITGAENVTGIKNFTNGLKVGGQDITYDSVNDIITYGAPLT